MKENQKEMLKIQREMKEGIEIISKRTIKRFGVSEVKFPFYIFKFDFEITGVQ